MSNSEVSAEWVAAYLHENPDFFAGQEALLAEMRLPHPSGQAISLLEKQNDLLRREVSSLRERLHHLIATARDNDHLFLRLRALVLALLDAHTWPDVLSALNRGLTSQFDVDAVQVVAFNEAVPADHRYVRSLSADTLRASHAVVLDQAKSWCGVAEPEVIALLFGNDQAANIGSLAMSPLMQDNQVVGVLVLGSQDAEYFRSSMDTLFLNHVSDVTSRLMSHWVN